MPFDSHIITAIYYNKSKCDETNPDKFELIATIKEDYLDFYLEGDSKRTDMVFIYKAKE